MSECLHEWHGARIDSQIDECLTALGSYCVFDCVDSTSKQSAARACSHSLMHIQTDLYTRSPTHLLAHSLTHSLTHTHTHTHIQSLTHSDKLSFNSVAGPSEQYEMQVGTLFKDHPPCRFITRTVGRSPLFCPYLRFSDFMILRTTTHYLCLFMSTVQCWKVFAMCASAFAPPESLRLFVERFLLMKNNPVCFCLCLHLYILRTRACSGVSGGESGIWQLVIKSRK